ncbi:hypothetical protein [Arthrobacter oryzae]|uniref:hypothetical protein n=1 Tax=Arthrobacter oryzae TaxID=409290 RepID=UPI00273AF206|nr:hypothetical protein [Arthrobacter oryzae]WLQ05812.1 hypothetical protein Q8Z05_17115 [Arthrobacter oryzae]
MQDPDQGELRRRLELAAPFFRDLGHLVFETYAAAGILNALPDGSFPVADARFHRTAEGLTYHPHGPVYFTVTRAGELRLGQDVGIPLTEAIGAYVQLAREQELEDAGPEEGATEGFPPPRLVLDSDTSRLYIADVTRTRQTGSGQGYVPVEQYIKERARLFVEAFRAAR